MSSTATISNRGRYRAASDVGGTFTDLVYYRVDGGTGAGGAVHSVKTDTTPPDFETGVMASLEQAGISPADLDFFAHGSTLVINALTEKKGVKTALITTKGFRDVLEIARGNRPDLFNFNFRKPAPFVERYLRAELDERVNHKGEVQKAVCLEPLPALLDFFRAEGVQAIAVCFLHSYINPENEIQAVARIKALWPDVSVLASHHISREWREYERTSTTVLAAFVHPLAKKYIESLEQHLLAGGFTGKPYMMQSNGGIATTDAARSNPIAMVESGPASGIFAAAGLGRNIGEENLIVLDIGGTTAKCALVENGEIRITTEYHIDRDRKNPGYPIQTPVTELVEIGNGGGSIAWIDAGNRLHVGPQSAGALPGPAAYGRGGARVTTTDANLVLGRIDPGSFVGGTVQPDWNAVTAAFKPLQDRLKLSREELARGIVRIANNNMTNALRLVSTNKGYDPRDFTLVAFGGGGALHALALAEELQVRRVVVPVNSAVFSAWGMLLTDLRRDYLQTCPMALEPGNAAKLASAFHTLTESAYMDYAAEGLGADEHEVVFEYHADVRYRGQEHTVKISFPFAGGSADLALAADRFHAAHEKLYTYRLDAELQVVNLHLVAYVAVDKPGLPEKPQTGIRPEDAILHVRKVDFDRHGIHDAAIYDGLRLEPGMKFGGPAVVQEASVSMVVPPDYAVTVDSYGNYHAGRICEPPA